MRYEPPKGWQLMWWLFRLFGFPFTLPWLIYHLIDIMKQKRKKATLQGKVVLITGASSGLGEALAHVFYNCGCKIILVSRRKEELERVKNALISTHHTTPTHPPIVLPLDLSDVNNLSVEIAKAIEIHGRIDILINNAGISYRGEAVNTKLAVDMKVMLINYFAQIALTKSVLPVMLRQQSGHVVCISSVQGKIAIPYRTAYAASKHALEAWCDSARAELADKKILMTIISPGYIRTSLSLNAIKDDGNTYGIMDKTIQEGYSAKYVAERVLKAVLREEKDVIIAPFMPKVAVLLRTICPSLYFWIMQRRARTTLKEE